MPIQSGYSNPISLLRYILTCQNWGDNATGEPSATALIRSGIGVNGSFDSATLDPVRNVSIRYMVDTEDKASTKDLIDKICKQFSLIQYSDASGYECVKYLFAETSDSDIPLFVIDETTEIGAYQAPDQSKLCVNPIIDYDYDYGLEKFTKTLEITNVQSTGTYSTLFTFGFEGVDGETYWNMCRNQLWPQSRHVEEMDSGWRENEFIYTYAGALFRLTNVIKMMKAATLDFTVPFAEGVLVSAGDIISLTFPHLQYTGQVVYNAVVTGVSKSFSGNNVNIECMLIGENLPFGLMDTTDGENWPIINSYDPQPLQLTDGFNENGNPSDLTFIDPTARWTHITQINDDLATLISEMDNCQIGIDTDNDDFIFKNDTGVLYVGAKQKHWSGTDWIYDNVNFANVNLQALTGDRALYLDSNKRIQSSPVTNIELGYVSGVTSSLQGQLDNKADVGHNHNGIYSPVTHNHDSIYSPLGHNHTGVYEPVITAGTSDQYWRGDKSWQTLNTTAVPEGTNYYFTNERVQSFGDTRYSLTTHNHDSVYAPISHNHSGVYEPFLGSSGSQYALRGDRQWFLFNDAARAAVWSGLSTGYIPYFNGTNLFNSNLQYGNNSVKLRATPVSWGTNFSSFEIGTNALWANYQQQDGYGLILSNNRYHSGAGNFPIVSGSSSSYEQDGASHSWCVDSGLIAGNAFSPTQKMKLFSNGCLELNTADSGYNGGVRIVADSTHHVVIALGAAAGGSGTQAGQWNILRYPSALGYTLGFRYNATDMVYIDTSGNMALGVSDASGPSAAPRYLSLGLTYSDNPVSWAKSKLFLYKAATEGFGFGIGNDNDIQYHSGGLTAGRHDFYSGNNLIVRHSNTGHNFYVSGVNVLNLDSVLAAYVRQSISHSPYDTQYNTSNLELISNYIAYPTRTPSISFHRAGQDAMTLFYAGGRTLQVRDHVNATADTILTSGNLVGIQDGHGHTVLWSSDYPTQYYLSHAYLVNPIDGVVRWRITSSYSDHTCSVAHSDISSNSRMFSTDGNGTLLSPGAGANWNDGLRIARSSNGAALIALGAVGLTGTNVGQWSIFTDVAANDYKLWFDNNNTRMMSLSNQGDLWIKTRGGDGLLFTGDNGNINRVSSNSTNDSELVLQSGMASITLKSVNYAYDEYRVQIDRSVEIYENLKVDGTLLATSPYGSLFSSPSLTANISLTANTAATVHIFDSGSGNGISYDVNADTLTIGAGAGGQYLITYNMTIYNQTGTSIVPAVTTYVNKYYGGNNYTNNIPCVQYITDATTSKSFTLASTGILSCEEGSVLSLRIVSDATLTYGILSCNISIVRIGN